jgi:hypothetical protein
MTEKRPCKWIAERKLCASTACDKQGPCDGFEPSVFARLGEAIRKRRIFLAEQKRQRDEVR